MVLGFYYHYPVWISEGKTYMPGFLGCFIDALAKEVSELVLITHVTEHNTKQLYDYEIKSTNISYVYIGPRQPAWYRHLFHRKILKPLSKIKSMDFFLLRSPTPLAPFFKRYLPNTKVVFMVVGDYEESVKQMPTRGIRDWVMKQYIKRNDYLFKKEMKTTDVLVNSPALFDKYKPIAQSIHQIRTTTLTATDIVYREDVLQGNSLNLLYTGRLDRAKGLFELFQAFVIIQQQYPQGRLHYVGWEEHPDKPIEQELLTLAKHHGVQDKIFFHGKKRIGSELNALYQMADIYIIPSYHEGFPRTIWEAMANGLPVIATRVGAIPEFLTHQKNALLIDPKQPQAIVDAIFNIINDNALRHTLIQEGYQLAKENTLEIQTKNMINILASSL